MSKYVYLSHVRLQLILTPFSLQSQYEYGSRAGVWRILRIFKQRAMKFTGYVVGQASLKNKAAIQAMVRDGHEVASHGWRWINYQRLPEQTHREHIRKCVEALKESAGYAPVGWYAGRVTEQSRKWLVEEYIKMGLPLTWDADTYSDDLPYWEKFDVNGEDVWSLSLPYSWANNDGKFVLR